MSEATLRPHVRLLPPASADPSGPPRSGASVIGPILGLVFGLSGLASGFYAQQTYPLVALALLGVLVAVLFAAGLPQGAPARLAAAAISALAGWTAVSMTWSESVERAWTETDRWILYAALLATALAAIRTVASRARTLAVLGAAGGLLTLVTLVRLLVAGRSMFFDHRLDAPVGYVNGTAGFLLMTLWPAVAFAVRQRDRPLFSVPAVAFASAEAGLLVLTQSRAILPALIVSVVLVLVIVPGRLVTAYALGVVAAAGAATLPWTLAVYEQKQSAPTAPPTQAVVTTAVASIIVASLVAALVWWVLVSFRHNHRARPLARALAVLGVVLALIAGVAKVGNPSDELSARYHDFKSLNVDESESSRFTGAGGFRYDLWRIAYQDFRRHPVRGLGAGNYGLTYFQQRRTGEPVRQPHSLEMQLLAELGLPGALLLGLLLVGAGWGTVRLVRVRTADAAFVAAAGLGTASVWLVHTSVDWLHVIPGLTGMALIALAALAAGGEAESAEQAPGRSRTIIVIVCLSLVAIAAAGVGRHYAATVKRHNAQQVIGDDPRGALRDTAAALRIDSEDVDTYVTRAAAFARLGDAADSDANLAAAIAREPGNYVLYALRGDLAVRRGRLGQGGRYYRAALARNPRDASLKLLVAHPESAVTG